MADALADLQDRTFAAATPATASTYPAEQRLTAEQLTSYLDRRSYAVLGSAHRTGVPMPRCRTSLEAVRVLSYADTTAQP